MGLLSNIFNHEARELKRFEKLADEIIEKEEEMSKLKDEDFAKKTEEFKTRLKNGET